MATFDELVELMLHPIKQFSVKAELQRVDEVLRDDENPRIVAVGRYEGTGNSLIILTDRRLITMNETGILNKRLLVHDIMISNVSHVNSETGSMGRLEINASGGDIEIDGISPGILAGEIADHIRDLMGTPSFQSLGPNPLEQLRELAALRDAGIVTAEEFEEKKVELLKRI